MLQQQKAKKEKADIEKAIAEKQAQLEAMRQRVAGATPGVKRKASDAGEGSTPAKQLKADALPFTPGGRGAAGEQTEGGRGGRDGRGGRGGRGRGDGDTEKDAGGNSFSALGDGAE